jgi:hypothetical protein
MTPPTKLPPRPMVASLFMAAPIVFIGALGVAVAILWGLVRFGSDTATGERVNIRFSAACMDGAAPVLQARAAQVGMDPQMEGSTMSAVLPELPEAAQIVPAMLVRPGKFSLVDNTGQVILDNKAIDEVAIDLDNAGMPNTVIKLSADARARLDEVEPTAVLVPAIDGHSFESVSASTLVESQEMTLAAGTGRTAVRMQRAADRAIVLAHGPLPCTVQVQGVAVVGSAG